MHLLTNSAFWIGVLTIPVGFLFLLFLARLSRGYHQWYKGTTPLSWFGIFLICFGVKLVAKRDCHVSKFNGRVWLSPNVEHMRLK